MIVGIASDHHGIEKRKKLIKYMESLGHTVIDYGSNGENADYPEYAFRLSKDIIDGKTNRGILICGTGIGMSIAANKVKGIRCARIASVKDAKLSSEHNHANVIAFSASIPLFKMRNMGNTYLSTEPSDLERHVRRVNMIDEYNG